MRLFIALELPDNVIAELETVQQRLRRYATRPVKWVSAASLHLTLHFLGEVEEDRVAPILDSLHAATVGLPLPRLQLASIGAFPSMKRPQTIWVGVGGDSAALRALHQAVVQAIQPLGFEPDRRPFHAHLTLGRVRREAEATELANLCAALEHPPTPRSLPWQSGPPALFQSTLTRSGAIYRKLSMGDV